MADLVESMILRSFFHFLYLGLSLLGHPYWLQVVSRLIQLWSSGSFLGFCHRGTLVGTSVFLESPVSSPASFTHLCHSPDRQANSPPHPSQLASLWSPSWSGVLPGSYHLSWVTICIVLAAVVSASPALLIRFLFPRHTSSSQPVFRSETS